MIKLGEKVLKMEVGDYLSFSTGKLIEVHRVPAGWIYVFRDFYTDSISLHTQFVPKPMEAAQPAPKEV